MEGFFEEVLDKNTPAKHLGKIKNPVRVDHQDPELYIVLDNYYSQKMIDGLLRFLNSTLKKQIRVKVISCFSFFVGEDAIKRAGQTVQFTKNCVDLTKYIPPNSKIVSVGRAIYSLTKTTSLHKEKAYDIKGFYDFIFNDTFFYNPLFKSYVFPIDDSMLWLGVDTFERFFAGRQLEQAYRFRFPKERIPAIKVEEIKNLKGFYAEHSDDEWMAIDTETSGLDFTRDRIGCVTMAFDSRTGYYLDWKEIEKDLSAFEQFIGAKKQIYANGKFDIKMLLHHGVSRKYLHVDADIIQLSHLINELHSNSLKTSAWLFTKHGGYDQELADYMKRYRGSSYLDIPKDILVKYAGKDAVVTYQVWKKITQKIKGIDQEFPPDEFGWTLETYYNEVMIPTINMFIDVEYRGMYINKERLDEISADLSREIEIVRKRIYKLLEVPETSVSIDSGKQLGELLEKKGWRMIERTKFGYYKTADAVLKKWGSDHPEEVKSLLKYRELSTLMKTFIGKEENNSGFYKYLRQHEDGSYRVHSSFHAMLADSHRNRSSEPNLQNQVKHGDWAKRARSIFTVPSDDYYIAEIDLAGLHLRICATLSGDPEMKRAFTELGGDMHSMSAQAVLRRDVSLEEFLEHKKEKGFKEYRFKAKAINFGLIFNCSAFSFAKESIEPDWTMDECKEYVHQNGLEDRRKQLVRNISATGMNKDSFTTEQQEEFSWYWAVGLDIKEKFFDTYPLVADRIEQQIAFAENNGYIRSRFGNIRRLPRLYYQGRDDDHSIIKNLQNISTNSDIQSYEAYLMMTSMVGIANELESKGMKSYLIGNVHDSAVMYIHKDELEDVYEMTKRYFERDIPEHEGVPHEAEMTLSDYSMGEYWGFGRDYFGKE